jgi:hypothetical protein
MSKLRLRLPLKVLVVAAVALMAVPTAALAQVAPNAPPIGLVNIVQNVQVINGQLVAVVQGVAVPLDLTAQRSPGAPCPILNLELGPIDLNLLGLRVQTSPICLDITARPNQGLLGQLLCGIARLLDRGIPLNQVLAGLTQAELTQLTGALQGILNGALNNLNQAVVTSVGTTSTSGPVCTILNLALGPLDLNLLGLQVELDDCANGPVTVLITAIPGGGLLGDLLCGLLGTPAPAIPAGLTLQQVIQLLLGALSL